MKRFIIERMDIPVVYWTGEGERPLAGKEAMVTDNSIRPCSLLLVLLCSCICLGPRQAFPSSPPPPGEGRRGCVEELAPVLNGHDSVVLVTDIRGGPGAEAVWKAFRRFTTVLPADLASAVVICGSVSRTATRRWRRKEDLDHVRLVTDPDCRLASRLCLQTLPAIIFCTRDGEIVGAATMLGPTFRSRRHGNSRALFDDLLRSYESENCISQ